MKLRLAVCAGALVVCSQNATRAEETTDSQKPLAPKAVWVTSVAQLGSGEEVKGGDGFVAATASGLLLRPSQVVSFSADSPSETSPLYEHPAAVWCVDVSSDSNTVASVDYRGNLVVYDMETGTPVLHQKACERWCQAMMFSPDDSVIIAGNEAGKILVWNVAEAKVTAEATIGEQSITDIAMSPDQTMVAAADAAGHVNLFAWPSLESKGKIKCGEEAAWSVAFDPEGKYVYVGSGDRQLYQAEPTDGAAPIVFGKGDDWLTNLSVSEEGLIVAGQPNGKLHFFSVSNTNTSPVSSLSAPSGVWAVRWNGANRLLVGTRKDGVKVVSQSWNWAPSSSSTSASTSSPGHSDE